MKKNRGLKRYYRNLTIQNDLAGINWFDINSQNNLVDIWHWHFDCKGYGNNSFKRRKPHLDKLFRHFQILTNSTSGSNKDIPIYAVILDHDSASDALFLRLPKSNNSVLPFKLSELSSTSNLKNKQLDEYLKALEGYVLFYGKAEENFCLIYNKSFEIGF